MLTISETVDKRTSVKNANKSVFNKCVSNKASVIKTENSIKIEKSQFRSPGLPQKESFAATHLNQPQQISLPPQPASTPPSEHDLPAPDGHEQSVYLDTSIPPPPPPPTTVSLSHLHRNSAFDSAAGSVQSGINGHLHHHHQPLQHNSNIEDHYRYSAASHHQSSISELSSIARPTVSYPSEIVTSRASYELATRNSYESSPPPPMQPSNSLSFDRYDPCMPPPQRSTNPNMYGVYLQYDEISQQKYYDQQMNCANSLKAEHLDDTAAVTPIYPRPIYQYDPNTGGSLPAGFSAMNLSVKLQAAAAAQQAAAAAIAFKSNGSVSPRPPPIIDLSTTSVSSSTSQTFNSTQYSSAVGRLASSGTNLSPATSPTRMASPHEPSPQTLDLSVSRMPPSGSPSYAVEGRFGRRPRSPQTEPVDFSAAPPRPMAFNMIGGGGGGGGVTVGGPTPYSRESTPDSGASHYMDNYRDHGG